LFSARGHCKFETIFYAFSVIIVSHSFVLSAVLEPSCTWAGASIEVVVVSVMATYLQPTANLCYFLDLFNYTLLLLRKLYEFEIKE
jgi:hypothetical protein